MSEEHPSAPTLSEIFNEAKLRPPGAEREQFLEEVCGGDAQLRADVEQLLRAYEDASRFLKPGPGVSPELEAQFAALKPEEAGDRIGHYKLLQQIGEGGFGVVWMAEQMEPVKRRVALKIIKLGMNTKEVVARFEQERQALAMMDHPNIARVLDAGATPTGRPYFVMELVRGIKITEYCDQSNLATTDRLQLFIAVCHAVQHAHQKGIIHRDLKPSNILVTLHDGVPVPKVIDFGVAKATQSQKLTELTLFTQFEQMIGTPLYMSPEQAEMSGLDIDTRSDIYSLGVLLYELLVGRTPFDPEKLLRAGHDEMRRVIREEDPPKPSTAFSTMQLEMRSTVARHRHAEVAAIAGLLRGDLDWIVMKALEKDRARRYETASGLAADVQRYLADEPVAASPPSAVYRVRKFTRRNKRGLAVAALVLFSLVLAGSGIGWTLRDRTSRHTKVAGRVELILTEVDQLAREQKWPEALAAARRAEAVVAGGEAGADTARRVRAQLKDLELLGRLEQVRMQEATWTGRTFDTLGADREYARAFRDYGVDLEALPVQTLIDHLKSRPPLAIPLAGALDAWAEMRRALSSDAASAKRLVAIARGIDPEPLRDRIRATWGKPTSEVREELRRLAESIEIQAQHPTTLGILGGKLVRAKLPDLALRIRREAQFAYPADFWLNYTLAHYLDEQTDHEGAVRFYTAAVSIRPNAVAAYNNLGNALKNQGKLDEAIVAYAKGIEIDPKFAYAYNNLGNALKERKELDKAITAYRKATELDPKNAGAFQGLGHALSEQAAARRDQKYLAEAIAAYRKAIEVDPNYALAYTSLGFALAAREKLDEAVAAYRKAIELDPKNANTHNNLGNALAKQKKSAEAIAAYRKAIELDPKDAVAYSNLGDALQGQRKSDEAIVACHKAIELDPKNAGAYNSLGNALRAQGKVDEGLAAHRKAIELDPKSATAYYNLGNALKDQRKMDEAIAAYRKATELDPKDGMPYNNLGNALRLQGKLDEALAAHVKAVELDPKNAVAYTNLGNGLASQKKPDEAIAAYRKAIELDPTDGKPYNNLGIALKLQGKLDEAIAAYHKAIELDPKNANAYNNLGVALRSQKKLDEAIAVYRKAIQIDPSDTGIYGNLGAVLQEQGNMDAAAAAYRQAIETNPNDAAAYRNLGAFFCCTLKDHGGAIAWLRKAIELDPKDANAHTGLGCALSHEGKTRETIAAYEQAAALDPQSIKAHNSLAWLFATSADATLRDPRRAIDLAKKAVELAPGDGANLNTLGVAYYRAGDWKAALAALGKSVELRGGGDSFDWFFLAMAHWQLGNKDNARHWHNRAVEWMEKNAPTNEELRRFRADAAELLGVNAKS